MLYLGNLLDAGKPLNPLKVREILLPPQLYLQEEVEFVPAAKGNSVKGKTPCSIHAENALLGDNVHPFL